MCALLFSAATLIGLSGGFFRPPAWLSSLHVCCVLRFAYAHGVPGCVPIMTRARFLHLSIRFCFFNCVCPQDSTPQGRPQTSTYTEGIRVWKSKGALHAIQFWCTYCWLRFHPRPLFWSWTCKCCVYVLRKHGRATPCGGMRVGGGRNIGLGVGYGWQHLPRDKFWVLV